jgi:hypothetical protein
VNGNPLSGSASDMSRQISISYRGESGADTSIEVQAPFYLLGTQRNSKAFWSIPRVKEIGIDRLAELGVADPVGFYGWEEMPLLDREITLLRQHLASIDFHVATKAAWLSHLVYCYHLLVETAPKASMPVFDIG